MYSFVNLVNMIIFTEALLMAQTLSFGLPHRKHYVLRLMISTAAGCGISYLVPILQWKSFTLGWINTVLVYLAILGFVALCVVFCVDAKWMNYLFCAVGGYAIHHLSGNIYSMFDQLIWKDQDHMFYQYPYCLLYFLVYLVIYGIFTVFFYRNRNVQMIVNRRQVIYFATLVVVMNIVFSSLKMFADMYQDIGLLELVSSLYSVAIGFFVAVMLFGILEEGYLRHEIEVVDTLYKENMRQYELSKATMESIHDLKHRISAVLRDSDGISVKERDELEDKIFILDDMVKTGNETLDIILAEKKMLCRQYGIEFDCMADGAKLSFMETYDLYVLFGNALSNAIEGTCRQPEGAPRLVFLNISGKDCYIAIHIENTYDGSVVFENGLPLTGKEDKMAHGFGIKSMDRITEKYQGVMTLWAEDGLFNLDIVFPAAQ